MTKNKPKILFLVNGLGLGNATRSFAVIEQICDDFEVHVACFRNSMNFFRSRQREGVHPLSLLPLEESSYLFNPAGGLSFVSIARSALSFFRSQYRNSRKISQYVRQHGIRLAVLDSDYSLLFAPFVKIQKIAINNAWFNVMFFSMNISRFPVKFYPHLLLVEGTDALAHFLIADRIFSPCVEGTAGKKSGKKIMPIPPIVRQGIEKGSDRSLGKKDKGILFMFSGASVRYRINLSRDFHNCTFYVLGEDDFLTDRGKNRIVTLQNIYDNAALIELLIKAEVVVTNAGHSSLSEIVYLNKKAILIPIQGHAEQYINSVLAKENENVCILLPEEAEEGFSPLFSSLLEKVPVPKKKAAACNGAAIIAEYVRMAGRRH